MQALELTVTVLTEGILKEEFLMAGYQEMVISQLTIEQLMAQGEIVVLKEQSEEIHLHLKDLIVLQDKIKVSRDRKFNLDKIFSLGSNHLNQDRKELNNSQDKRDNLGKNKQGHSLNKDKSLFSSLDRNELHNSQDKKRNLGKNRLGRNLNQGRNV
jgi:hypothetical protein